MLNGVVVSWRDVVEVAEASGWLGLVVDEPGAPVIAVDARKSGAWAEAGADQEERARIQTTKTDDAVRLWVHASIAVYKGER